MSARRAAIAVLAGAALLALRSPEPAAAQVPQGAAGSPARIVVERVLGGAAGGRRTFGQWLTGVAPTAALERPYAAAWDGEELLVADPAAGRVVRFDARGRERGASPQGALVGPIGVAVCRWGVVVTDSRRGVVALFDHELRPQRELATGLARPSGVACDAARIFVVETAAHRVLALLPQGGLVEVFGGRGTGDGEFNFPAALALDGDTLLVGDTLNFRIQRLRIADGRHLRSFGRLGDAAGETPRVKGIAVDAAGRIWVSDAHLDQVAIFDREGRLLGDFGRPGRASGELAFPAGLAVASDGRVAVVDSLNRRVQILRLLPPGEPAKSGGRR